MAHYAIIENLNHRVIEVRTGVDENITQIDLNGTEVGGSSEAWEAFYTKQLQNPNLYVKRCSYNSKMRGQYPGIGDVYDPDKDEFITPKEEV